MTGMCKTCKFYIDHYTEILDLGIKVETADEEGNITGCRRLTLEFNNEAGTGICGNEYSELSGCGVHDGGWCDNYMKRTNNSSKDKDPFEVFKNYKCDGQLAMQFNGDNIMIQEEPKENSKSKALNIMQVI